MTKRQIELLQIKQDRIWDKFREMFTQQERDMIAEYVENEILLEQESNK